jgi:hypothetical protein
MGWAGLATAGIGAGISTLGNLMKKKVNAPGYKPIDTGEEIKTATAANLNVLGQAEELASRVNEGAQERLLRSLQAAVPGFENIVGQTSENIQANLAGQIPEDVQRAIQRAGASRAVASGVSGSQFGRNLTARDLGLTSLQLMNQGVQQSNQFLANARQNLTAPQFDVSNMFVSPAQQLQVTAQNRANQYNAEWLQRQLSAAQSWQTIVGGGLNQFGQSLGSMGSLGGTQAPSQPSTGAMSGGMFGAMGGIMG